MRKLTPAAAVLLSAVLASPVFAQISAVSATASTPRSNTFSLTPSSYTYTVVDTSKAAVPSTAGSSATTLGNGQSRPINVTGALQQSYNPIGMGNTDPTRALRPRQPTNMFQIPNIFSRITSVNLVPTFLRTRTTTTQFPTPGPQQQTQ